MRTRALASMLLAASNCLCQTPATESSTLRSLLVEVHQLRQDIESMTVASQRVQIALYSLQMQDAAVARATLRLDEIRNKCSGEEAARDRMAGEAQRLETSLASGTLKESEMKDLREHISQIKRDLEVKSSEAQACQAAESQASSQFHNEQAKLTELQDRISHLDRALEKLGADPK